MRFSPSIIAFSLIIFLSSCSVTARIKRADRKYAIGEYYEAAEMYRQLWRNIPSQDKQLKAQVAFNQAECYRNINSDRAINAYKNAIRNRFQDSIVYLHYAQALHYQGKYSEAIKQYEIYLLQHPTDTVAMAGKYACNIANEWKKTPSRYKVTLAKEFYDKRSSAFSPTFTTSDADVLFFTSNRQEKSTNNKKKTATSSVTGQPYFNIYSMRKNAAGKWEDLTKCEGLFEQQEASDEESSAFSKNTTNIEIGVCSFTADGRSMYYTYSAPINGQDLGTKIFCSQRASGEWGLGQEIKLFSDSSITVGHPSISANGDTLYFVSDAPGGFGGKDIYMAIFDGSEWSDIRNLGPKINTADDELFPHIRHNGQLYFASKGHPGLGGLDLFLALHNDTTYKVYNMGVPFNSNGDDFGITFAGTTESGFFSSNRGQKKANDLIYAFILPEMEFLIEGNIFDNQGQQLNEAQLRLIGDDGTNVKAQVRRDGTYRLKLNKETRYAMLATARGYLNQKFAFSTQSLADSYTFQQDFILSPISKPVKMSNVFYNFGQWTLTTDSETGLQELVSLLNDNPNITIELSAHTDFVGNDEHNKTLSLRRAQSVVDYLIQHGIASERLTPVGYGEEQPVVVDEFLHKQYTFLPKDQVLDEAFITTLSPEQQEICNSLNRRTEFRVLKTTYHLY